MLLQPISHERSSALIVSSVFVTFNCAQIGENLRACVFECRDQKYLVSCVSSLKIQQFRDCTSFASWSMVCLFTDMSGVEFLFQGRLRSHEYLDSISPLPSSRYLSDMSVLFWFKFASGHFVLHQLCISIVCD